MFNLKDDFPFFHNAHLVYLDSAATTQKPKIVLEAMDDYYETYCANIHRASHELGNKATQVYENSREYIAKYIGANSNELVFTKGTTEGINLVASSFVKDRYKTVILTQLEHHSNIVPWQLVGLDLKVIKIDEDLNIDLVDYERLLKQYPNSFVALIHVSNCFGIINPIKKLINLAHQYGSKVLVDGAQAIAHLHVDVKELDADFYVFSAHKVYGPTGVGAMYAKAELLEVMKPYHGGGAMIKKVSFEESTFLEPPFRFEAGTQAIAEVIGFSIALKYLSKVKDIEKQDALLMDFTKKKLLEISNVLLYTNATNVSANISFNIKGIHHDDIGKLLSKQNIMLRTGHHCAMPAMEYLGIDGSVRISFGIYSTKEDVLIFIDGLKKTIKMLS